ncbi:TetR/AcrR family transcriptional regulator [Corynebacterium glyciniphilum]|uniref:TetR/AcrR family transcriptional regulator n=1 Tax=Corynebacterium glyciniphilum TaxID=1404244 RepID=UPI003DA0B7CE
MNPTQADIVAAAESVFDAHGFAATGMDRLTQAAGVSSRTLYKHVGSKTGLMVAVLRARMERFFTECSGNSVDELFFGLQRWMDTEGARGCLFLRALGETGDEQGEVSSVVAEYRNGLRALIMRAVASEIRQEDEAVALQILVIFEGVTSTASYLGNAAVAAGREAAAAAIAARGSTASEPTD